MKQIFELTPDTALSRLLKGNVRVQTSATASRNVSVYADGERPNTKLPEELIEITWNGAARSVTKPLGFFRGNIALLIWVRTQPDGRAKKKIISQIINQCAELVNGKTSNGFYFELNPMNVIMPTTVNLSTAYSATTLNVEWHTTEKQQTTK